MNHPRLGTFTHADHRWHGTIELPLFAEYGSAVRPPSTSFPIHVEDDDGSGLLPEQDRAIDLLLDTEAEVRDQVWSALTPILWNFDPRTEISLWEVEVSRLHLRGIAYLCFQIEVNGHLEHGFSVVYHPTQGTFWADSEGLNQIEVADNLY